RGSSDPIEPSVPTVMRSGRAAPAGWVMLVARGASAMTKSVPIAVVALRTPPPALRSIAHDLARRVESRNAGDAAAAVGCAARLVQAGDRRTEVGEARCRTHVEQLV